MKIFAEDVKSYVWTPMLARVNGSLPADELPQMVGRGRNRYGVGRFFVEVTTGGKVPMTISGKLKELEMFIGEEKIALPADQTRATIEVELKPGRHRFTVAGLLGWGFEEVTVELLGDAGAARAVGPGG